jgi:DNA-binding XRE family transcriptional regulator
MPRTPKDPNNPITKLRRQLSSSNQLLTREMFAKRYGFSPETLKALETGRYRLTQAFAIKIGVAVGVDPNSLLENRDPLVDWHGNPITPQTEPALRHLDLNANARLQILIRAAFAAAKKHPKGDRSALFVVLFDFWLAEVVTELKILLPFWGELFVMSDVYDALGKDPVDRLKKPRCYLEHPKEVDISDYGFHEAIARGLARGPMHDYERKKLIFEYLTPSEVKEYDVPVPLGEEEKLGQPERIAYRRFAKAKGIDPDDHEAISEAFWAEAGRRFNKKEEEWLLHRPEVLSGILA